MGCRILIAIFLIVLGGWIWASNWGITVFSFYRDWPVILILIGMGILLKFRRRRLSR
ncbi:MAG: DUF5668 domain-containing protein [candidate division WOR-3 bacterium]